MKFFKKLFALLTMLIAIPTMSSCGLFVDEEEALEIQSIEALPDLDEDGNVVIIITFKSEDQDPITIKIPKGSDGEQGVGIKSIEDDSDPDTGVVTVTITLDNGEMHNYELQPGASIVDTRYEPEYEKDEDGNIIYDEENKPIPTGNTLVYFIDSYGNEYGPVPVQKGDSGEDGAGVYHAVPEYHKDGSVTLWFYMTDGREFQADIPAPIQGEKGEDGRSIESVVSGVSDGQYLITINYSDGTSDELSFPAPERSAQWHTITSDPSAELGENGDYAFDINHDTIWHKENNIWVKVVIFPTDEQEYTVTFNLNAAIGDVAKMPDGYSSSYKITRGNYFKQDEGIDIPIPTNYSTTAGEYYKFVGWCTSSNPLPTSGYFTDLTPVFGDLELFAIWEL